MAFCVECGAEQPSEAKFCLSCGKPVVEGTSTQPFVSSTPINLPPAPAPAKPKRPLNKKFLLIGAAVAVVLVVVAIALSGSKSLSLTASQAQERLMAKADFPFDAKKNTGSSAYTIADATLPLFNSQDSCTEDGEFADLIKSDGKLLASTDFDESANESSFTHFDEDIVQFTDSATALKALDLARAAYENPNCEYDETDWESTVSGASDAQTQYGIGGSDSFYFEYDWVYSTDLVNLSENTDTVVVVNGPYLIYLQGSIDPDTGSVSRSDMHEAMRIALEKVLK